MLRSLGDLTGMSIRAEDGEIGTIDRFFFDDERWAVRHVVVDLGKWLPGRRVLLSPAMVEAIDDRARAVRVRVTRDRIRNSPDVDTDKPVSRQQEMVLQRHYGYAPYWGGSALWGPAAYPAALYAPPPPVPGAFTPEALPDAESDERPSGDPHLRSTKEVAGYHIRTTDGEVGHVDDFLMDDETWAIQHLVVDTSNWPGGRSVLVPADWVRDVDWTRMQIDVKASAEAVRNSPEYQKPAPG